MGKFVDAIGVEARLRMAELDVAPRSIYLGGGTPSMLSPRHLERLFGDLRQVVDFSGLDEVTLEANPATFDLAKAELFRSLGVTRVSLGVQSFSPHVLEILGREHSLEQACEAVHLLRQAGMPQVNIDLMFSIPGQSTEDWRKTLECAIDLQPDHISAYNLTYEEDTVFFEGLKNGTFAASEDTDAHYFYLADEMLAGAGYEHYETSNYAQPGAKSSHNSGYWRGEDYLGLGPSAVSTLGGIRSKNVSDTTLYMERIQSIGNAVTEVEELSTEDLRLERIALGLRTDEGIPMGLLDAMAVQRVPQLEAEGFARVEGGRLILMQRGRALVDPIAAELI